jgi:glycosyltransferase involved in cell wall biosynthesis
MKIVNIVPGFGGTFYCGNCLRDSAFTKTLRADGHEAITLPLYMPLLKRYQTDPEHAPIFYGAVNIYLEQKIPFLRRMPRWMHNFFNSEAVLNYASKKSGSTRARGLEEMTISMLKGEEGFQKDELEQLIDYLKFHEKPDIVHLSNALLMGLAGRIRDALKIPVICSLQDEDMWIDTMSEKYQPKLWNLMSEKAHDIDAFIAVSQYFAGLMQQKMHIPDHKLHMVHIGVEPEVYSYTVPNVNKPVIAFLSRSNHENGFEILVDAFIQLKQQPGFENIVLKVNGGHTNDDAQFIKKQVLKLKRMNFLNDVVFSDDFRTEKLGDFFKDVSVLSVPVLKGEAFGLFQLEALACGVPLVQPELGAFPEIINISGGGAVYQPNTADALCLKLEEVLSDHETLLKMSKAGRESVLSTFNIHQSTQKMFAIYQSVYEQFNNTEKELLP